ncbi:hypothetical protein PR048_000792 [Dryococelus australis]|uniref:Uncharacterized protein n=1 Tax=Dryococelus australis TaxID=614101 RepID=A0ABQ9IFK4_9NEOP|nr:hypothetical protein PR048_000792 [Dryococelus australis]
MERRRNARAEEMGDLRENLPISSIVRHDSQVRKSGSDPVEPGLGGGGELTCDSSLVKTASKANILGAATPRRRSSEAAGTEGSTSVTCLRRASTLRKARAPAPDSGPLTRSITFTCAQHDKQATCSHGATVTEGLACSPPTKAIRVQSPAGSPDFRVYESCRTMLLVSRSSRGSPIFPALSFRRRSTLISITLIGSQDHADAQPTKCRNDVKFSKGIGVSPIASALHENRGGKADDSQNCHTHRLKIRRAAVAGRLDCSPATNESRVQTPAGSLPDFRESSVRQSRNQQPIRGAARVGRRLLKGGEEGKGWGKASPAVARCGVASVARVGTCRVRNLRSRDSPPGTNRPTLSLSVFEAQKKRGSDKDDTVTQIKCAIAPKRKALNWRALFSSCCVGGALNAASATNRGLPASAVRPSRWNDAGHTVNRSRQDVEQPSATDKVISVQRVMQGS